MKEEKEEVGKDGTKEEHGEEKEKAYGERQRSREREGG